MSDYRQTGGCFCGQVRFAVSEAASFTCFCHCRSCQLASGGAVVAWASFSKPAFELAAGTLQLHLSSPGVTRGHCVRCGSSISYESERRAGEIDIAVVCFDDPGAFRPQAHIWMEDALASLQLDDDLPRFARTVS